jgi:hypothetical protein
MTSVISWHLLPPGLIEIQLGQIDLLLAMYPDEIQLETTSQEIIDNLRNMEDGGTYPPPAGSPSVSMLLKVVVSEDTTLSEQELELDLTFPFIYEGTHMPEDPPQVKVRVRQPSWLSRAATADLMTDLPKDDDLLGTIEHIKEAAAQQLEQAETTAHNLASQNQSSAGAGPMVRVWFYFPSISTRSKRDDFIIHAPSYQLTGFLYAGKPGLLCVEGDSQNIDDYMKFIKTESWGDIPAHHKKVSERYRETKDVQRVFPNMTETTDMVGERRGQRANRGDMKAMEEWLTERGLGDAFAKVLM